MGQVTYAQETCFIYKRGNPKVTSKDANARKRLAYSNSTDSDQILSKRLSRFLEAREILEKSLLKLTKDHLHTTITTLEAFVKESTDFDQLSTIFLVKADVKAYIEQIKITQPHWHTISIHSKECPNFKSTVKLIVNRFTESQSHLVLDRRLTYDFHVLIDWSRGMNSSSRSEKLLVIVEDTDGFEPGILRDLIAQMHTYVANKELNLHLILNLAVPLPSIEENLTLDNIIAMRVKVLQGSPLGPKYLQNCADMLRDKLQLVLSSALLERVFDLDVAQASRFLLYATIAHFDGNPLACVSNVQEFLELGDVLSRLPSVHANLKKDPTYSKCLDPKLPLSESSFIITELQVGGVVLDSAFNPNYRPLIEQALTDPRIYSRSFAAANRMSVPSSVLYQLSRESSIYINIYDFYCAFREMVSPVVKNRDAENSRSITSNWDKQSMAIFLESITSLKMIGILRDCKRKFECVEKVSWKGV